MKTITLILFILCLHGLYGAISPELFFWHQPELQHISSSASRSVIAYSDEPYMFSGFNNVEVWDVSNPDLPRQGYTFHNGLYGNDVYANPKVINNLLFFSVAPHTFVYDISDIYQPVLLYDISIQNSFCFGIFQNYLLLGMLNGDIMIYDFNDPTDIQYKGSHNVLPCIWNIYEFGDKIAVSCGLFPSRTIKLLELNEITYTFSEYSSCELFAIDSYVGKLSSKMLIQTTENDIIVFDCSTQGTAALLTNFPASDEMLSVVTDGRLLYTVSAQNCLKAWEFNHQNEFVCLSSYYFPQSNYPSCQLFKITGKILPCKAGNNYAYWLDISDLQPPENLISQFENGIDISTMAFLDMGYGYIYYDSPQGFALLEINSDNSISENCVFDSLRTLYKLNMNINFLYGIGTTNYEQVIKAYDCSVPTQPVLVSEIPCPDDALFKMSGNVLYAGPNDSFSKYRINLDTGIPLFETNLSFPNSIATTTAPISCNDVIEYQGNDYAVGQWRPSTFQWYPYLAYRFSDNETGCVMQDNLFDRLYARDDYLYTLGRGIYTYSVFPDAAPELRNVAYNTSIFTKALCVIPYLENYLIASYSYSNCIAIFDISSPANPVLVRKLQQPYPAYSLFVKEDKLFAANGIHGISVYELSGVTHNSDHIVIPIQNIISANPNPFSTQVKLAFELKQPGPTKTAIYNVKGQLVKVIGSAELKQGKTELVWDGKDSTNRTCAAGVYFVRVNSATPFKVKKILKLQ